MRLDLGGHPTRIFSAAVTGLSDTFNVPPKSGDYSGKLVLQAVGTPAAGTITALVTDLQISLDGGTTWAIFITGTNLQTGPKALDVGGLGSGALLRLNTTTFTLGTATGIDIYAIAG